MVFLNHNLSGHLQGLLMELNQNTNSVRVELNRLEETGILSTELEGRRKHYRVNEQHPLTENLTAIVPKTTGVDVLVDRVVGRLPGLEQVWVCRNIAQGLKSEIIECVLVGEDLNDTIPERPVCEKMGIALIDGLGDKIQSSSWLLKKL